MKKTRITYLFRSIRKGGVSFLAVAVIAAVSIAIFHGFQSSANAILQQADQYFNENNLETLEISCANGITESDLDAIAEWDGVKAVEGGYTDSVLLERENGSIQVQARSLLDTINQPSVIEGTLPSADNEAAIESYMAEQEDIQVGDTLTINQDGCLKESTFQVTAIIDIPVYCCVSLFDVRGTGEAGLGSNEYYICLPESAFNGDHYQNCYTTAYIDSTVLDGLYYFSDDYAQKEEAYLDQLEPLSQSLAEQRYETLRQEVETDLQEAQAEIDEHQADLDSAKEELEQGESDYQEAQSVYDSQKELLEQSRDQLESQLAALGISTDLDQALTSLTAMGNAGIPLRGAITQYQEGEAQLEDATDELESASRELEDARAEISDGEAELQDAQKELEDARIEADDLEVEDWVISGRENVGDIRGITSIVDAIYGLSIVMAALFLLVAVVISFASITRVIREQRVLIGAQKALGLTSGEILRHFIWYNLICAFVGILLGWLLAIVIVENMSLFIFAPKFCIGKISLTFTWSTALLSAALCLAVFLVATFVTCTKMSKEPAIDLLRGDTPTRGKRYFFEKWGAYRKMNLYSRTMLKNVLSDKGRMATTIVGVMGCTALLVACFSMKLGIQNALSAHFDQCASYDYRLVTDSGNSETEDFSGILDQNGISYTQIQDKLKNFRSEGGTWETAHIVTAPDSEALDGFMKLVDIQTGDSLSLPDNGILISRRAAEEQELSVGSTVEIMDADGQSHPCQVAGIIEHYLPYHLIVTSDSYYESVMGEAPDRCVFLLKGNIDGLEEQVQSMDGFLALRDSSEYDRSGGELNMVIAICTALSAVMSVLVLLNQISMYITRKARELAVMRVNGYTLAQTRAYVYKDNIVLIILGLILGCVFGSVMAYIDIRVIEAGAEHYVRTPNLLACLLACVIMAVFAVAVNIIALRRINHLSLTNVSSN